MLRILPAIAVMSALALPVCAHASSMTYHITFTASDYSVPAQTFASGSYTLTFDPTLNYENETTGLTVNSFNEFNDSFTPPTSSVFSFSPGSDVLIIAGAPSGWVDPRRLGRLFSGYRIL